MEEALTCGADGDEDGAGGAEECAGAAGADAGAGRWSTGEAWCSGYWPGVVEGPWRQVSSKDEEGDPWKGTVRGSKEGEEREKPEEKKKAFDGEKKRKKKKETREKKGCGGE